MPNWREDIKKILDNDKTEHDPEKIEVLDRTKKERGRGYLNMANQAIKSSLKDAKDLFEKSNINKNVDLIISGKVINFIFGDRSLKAVLDHEHHSINIFLNDQLINRFVFSPELDAVVLEKNKKTKLNIDEYIGTLLVKIVKDAAFMGTASMGTPD